MDLSPQTLIDSLIADLQPVRRQRVAMHSPGQSAIGDVLPGARKGTRHCHCGVCSRCIENARWEEIFEQKFADPNYYSRRSPPHQSPLSEI